jgi:thiamine-phosphate pyrophosphorylase
MYENFTDRARKIMQLANQEANRCKHEYIGTEHILLGLMLEAQGVAAATLKYLGLTIEQLRAEAARLVQNGNRPDSTDRLPETPRIKKLLEYSTEEAHQLHHRYVGTEHLLLALVREPDCLGAQILSNLGVTLKSVRKEVLNLLGHNVDTTSEPKQPTQNVSKTSNHSTLRILDAVANRAAEGLRVVEDFCRFALDDRHLTTLVKEVRHHLGETLTALPREDRHAMRETQQDVGTDISTPAELQRTDAAAVCVASCERVKQSLRSLEEFSKTLAPEVSVRLEALRYRWYTIEKAITGRLRLSGSALEQTKLCVLIDGSFSEEKVRAIIEAGVGMIQLRDKNLSDRELLAHAKKLREICHSPTEEAEGCLLIVNDRPDIATTVDADGVHLGQDDLPVKAAREILGPRKIIGVSTHNIEQARQAVLDGVDYIGVGPTFPSTTKSFEDFPGTALLKQIADEISLPAFAIGGIMLENLPEVLATGINRVAVSGAITKADEPGEVVKEFLRMSSI